jgi:hypothetical protein
MLMWGKADSEAEICLSGVLIRECENFLDVGNSKMTEQCILWDLNHERPRFLHQNPRLSWPFVVASREAYPSMACIQKYSLR